MRILFLAPQPFFEVRGTPLAVRFLLQEVTALGHEVTLLTYPQGTDLPISGVKHLRSLPLPVGRVRAGPSLQKLLLDAPFFLEAYLRMTFGRYDLVHAVEEAAPLASPLARLLGLPLVYDMDSSIPDQLQSSGWGALGWIARLLENHALAHAVAVVTVCTALTESVRSAFPAIPLFQIEDPPLPGTLENVAPEAVERLKRSLELPPQPLVLYSGNFEAYQGVEILVDATKHVSDACFLFVGGETPEIEALKERARRAGTDSRCFFVGKRPLSDLPLLQALSTVLVSPRIQGTNTPFKIYSYLASRRPLVATRIGSHTQVLNEDVAYLVSATPEGLADGIRRALEDEGAARARAERGRALLEKEYAPARYREKIKAAYAQIEERLKGRESSPGRG